MSTYKQGDTTIYYEQYGNGPDLVFLHGYTCNLEHWRWIANALSKQHLFNQEYRVLLYDMRCHGSSGKQTDNLTLSALTEEAHDLIRGLGIQKPVIIGHSMGGMMALEYGLCYPDQVRALILAEAHTHIDTTARIIGSGVSDARTAPETARQIDADMGAGGQYVTQSLFESLMKFDVRQRVASLKMPVLFLWGDRYGDLTNRQLPVILDEFGFREMADLMARYIHQSHHFIMLEQPDETLKAIRQFLGSLSGSL